MPYTQASTYDAFWRARVWVLLYLFAIFLYIRCTSDIVFFYIVAFVPLLSCTWHMWRKIVLEIMGISLCCFVSFFFVCQYYFVQWNSYDAPSNKMRLWYVSFVGWYALTHDIVIIIITNVCYLLMLNLKSHQSFRFRYCCVVNNGISALKMQWKWNSCAEHQIPKHLHFMMRIKTPCKLPLPFASNGQNVSKRYIKQTNSSVGIALTVSDCRGQYCIQNVFNVRTYPELFMPILDALWMHNSNRCSLCFIVPFASSYTPWGFFYCFGFGLFKLFNPSQNQCETLKLYYNGMLQHWILCLVTFFNRQSFLFYNKKIVSEFIS